MTQSITLPRSVVEQAANAMASIAPSGDAKWSIYSKNHPQHPVFAALCEAIDTSAERVQKSAESEHGATAKAIFSAIEALKQSRKALNVLWVSHQANRTDAAIEGCDNAISQLESLEL